MTPHPHPTLTPPPSKVPLSPAPGCRGSAPKQCPEQTDKGGPAAWNNTDPKLSDLVKTKDARGHWRRDERERREIEKKLQKIPRRRRREVEQGTGETLPFGGRM